MSKVTKIHTNFILEVLHNDIEYHVTISEDLKDIFDIDVVDNPKHQVPIGNTEMREVVWEAFMGNKLELD
jgi:hypothetical protein